MSASKFFKEGDLEQAIQACIEDVKEDPANANQRVFFAELLCFSGDYDRADRQLNTLLTLDPKTMLTVSVWRQLLRAAQIRQDVYECKQVPELMDAATPRIENALRALTIANKDNVLPESVAEQEGASEPVVVNGISSSHFRDLDDINANILEVMASNGRYFWIDFDQIDSLEFYAPERPLDLLWRKARLNLTCGKEGEVFIPAIYPTVSLGDNLAKLGHKTDWVDVNGVTRGVGLRSFLLEDDDITLIEIETMSCAESLALTGA